MLVPELARRTQRARALPSVAIAALAGLAVGVLTVVGQGALPDRFNIANSGAVWLIPVAFIGWLMPSDARAAVAGAAALFASVVGYYASVPLLVDGAATGTRSVVIWGVAALIAGPVFAVAGRWTRDEPIRRRVPGLALLGGVFLGEGLARILTNDQLLGWAMIAGAIAVPLAVGRSARERLIAILAEIPVLLVTMGAYGVIDWLFLHS